MSTPRFLTDHDFNERIVRGVRRREPLIEILKIRQVGDPAWSDDQILEFAAQNGLLVLSHDVNTMTAAALQRIAAGLFMAGVFFAPQTGALGKVIDDIILIWSASNTEDWAGAIEYLPFH